MGGTTRRQEKTSRSRLIKNGGPSTLKMANNSSTTTTKGRAKTRSDKPKLIEDPSQEEAVLNLQLRRSGLYAANILGDGNCLFRALSDQLFGSPQGHLKLREQVCGVLERRPEMFRNFVDESDYKGGWNGYVREMRQSGTYGTNIELSAFVQLYQRPIKVFQPGLVYVIQPEPNTSTSDSLPIPSTSQQADPGRPLSAREKRLKARQEKNSSTSKKKESRGKPPVEVSPDVSATAEAAGEDTGRDSGPLCIVYHSWEHYSSLRNLKGPHTGPPRLNIALPLPEPIPNHSTVNGKKRSNDDRESFSTSGSQSPSRSPSPSSPRPSTRDSSCPGGSHRDRDRDRDREGSSHIASRDRLEYRGDSPTLTNSSSASSSASTANTDPRSVQTDTTSTSSSTNRSRTRKNPSRGVTYQDTAASNGCGLDSRRRRTRSRSVDREEVKGHDSRSPERERSRPEKGKAGNETDLDRANQDEGRECQEEEDELEGNSDQDVVVLLRPRSSASSSNTFRSRSSNGKRRKPSPPCRQESTTATASESSSPFPEFPQSDCAIPSSSSRSPASTVEREQEELPDPHLNRKGPKRAMTSREKKEQTRARRMERRRDKPAPPDRANGRIEPLPADDDARVLRNGKKVGSGTRAKASPAALKEDANYLLGGKVRELFI